MYDELINYWGLSEETVNCVTDINGYNEKTMYDILDVTQGENMFMFEEE